MCETCIPSPKSNALKRLKKFRDPGGTPLVPVTERLLQSTIRPAPAKFEGKGSAILRTNMILVQCFFQPPLIIRTYPSQSLHPLFVFNPFKVLEDLGSD